MARLEGYNRHHCISPKFKYRYPVAKQFREHPFLINTVQEKPHAQYHAENDHPLLLSREQMLGALAFLDEMAGEAIQAHERVEELACYLDERSDREARVGTNLHIQALFIAEYGVGLA